jgi:hypothetical protein
VRAFFNVDGSTQVAVAPSNTFPEPSSPSIELSAGRFFPFGCVTGCVSASAAKVSSPASSLQGVGVRHCSKEDGWGWGSDEQVKVSDKHTLRAINRRISQAAIEAFVS